jgi:hypothetical protein
MGAKNFIMRDLRRWVLGESRPVSKLGSTLPWELYTGTCHLFSVAVSGNSFHAPLALHM